MWHHYCQNSQGIIYVIDSTDKERFTEAKEELYRILKEESLKDTLLLIFANKQDMEGALTKEEIKEKLELSSLKTVREWHIEGTVATTGEGLYEGLDWLTEKLG